MKEHNIIHEELIFMDEELVTKKEVIQAITNQACQLGYVTDVDLFMNAVLAREEEVPTAIGYGIAIPHGKADVVEKPFIAFLRTSEPFKWTQGHEEAVQLIFLIGVPNAGTEKLHLRFISQVSKKLLDEDFRHQLLTIGNKTTLFERLRSIDI
ncbi:PTS sugar transporter subunit IIA [Streptococcus respiraculi]|uniref:PTS sugar transporter subunit IIA n=1 Tax=Streptococcus respiraculi TaxID=2021971 RepID=UPI000E70CD0C|nr:fructose PTS transporter subunit IIA [Streptococcus respiraculi]